MMKERPGMMIYFDNKDCFEALSDADLGKLMKGAMAYAMDGLLPQLEGDAKFAWLMLKPRIDFDRQRYFKLSRQKSYAVYCREQEKKQLPKLSFAEWDAVQTLSNDAVCYPTTSTPSSTSTSTPSSTSTSTSSSSPSSSASSSASAAATTLSEASAETDKRGFYGLDKTIRMTKTDFNLLIDEIGLTNLTNTMLYAEPKAKELGYDTDCMDWKRFLRQCWDKEVKPKKQKLACEC